MMRVTLHDYVTDPGLPQKDGVNLAHENIAELLKTTSNPGLVVTFHDFRRLLKDHAYAREILSSCDCVVSNVGPHAHYYFHLREKMGLDFAIIRDVRTAIWSSYLLQEYLCQPYLRKQDLLLVASNYTRGVYEKLFPHLKSFRCIRCYPLTIAFPERSSVAAREPRPPGKPCILGYVGRLSEDKNFPEIVELLVELNRQHPGAYQLVACGDIHSSSCLTENIHAHLHKELGSKDCYVYHPARPNCEIWELYAGFDVLIFPSTSNLETLGRVLIEASYAGIPVVCGAHAAASELMPEESLCRVGYRHTEVFDTHYDHSLGSVSVPDMAHAVRSGRLKASACYREYATHPDKFLDCLLSLGDQAGAAQEALILTDSQRQFIRSLKVELPRPLDRSNANRLLEQLLPWFEDLQNKNSDAYQERLRQLVAMSRFPERTWSYIEKSACTLGDFTNVGGVDVELCHVAGFYPSFQLN